MGRKSKDKDDIFKFEDKITEEVLLAYIVNGQPPLNINDYTSSGYLQDICAFCHRVTDNRFNYYFEEHMSNPAVMATVCNSCVSKSMDMRNNISDRPSSIVRQKITAYVQTGLFDNFENHILLGSKTDNCIFCLSKLTDQSSYEVYPLPLGQTEFINEGVKVCYDCKPRIATAISMFADETDKWELDTFIKVETSECPKCKEEFPILKQLQASKLLDGTLSGTLCDLCLGKYVGVKRESTEVFCMTCAKSHIIDIGHSNNYEFLDETECYNPKTGISAINTERLCYTVVINDCDYSLNAPFMGTKERSDEKVNHRTRYRVDLYICTIDQTYCESTQKVNRFFISLKIRAGRYPEDDDDKGEFTTIMQNEKDCKGTCTCFDSFDEAAIQIGKEIASYENKFL